LPSKPDAPHRALRSPAHEVQDPLGPADRLSALDGEPPPEGFARTPPGYRSRTRPPGQPAALAPWDRSWGRTRSPANAQVPQGRRPGAPAGRCSDGQVVDQREGQEQVGGASVRQGHPFQVLPPDPGAWVGQVRDQRKDRSFPRVNRLSIIHLDTFGVDVEAYCEDPALRGDPAERADVPTQIPQVSRPNLIDEAWLPGPACARPRPKCSSPTPGNRPSSRIVRDATGALPQRPRGSPAGPGRRGC
jgi:hypothetical protein